MSKEEVITVDQLKADDLNANRGTARGAAMLLDSLKKFGAGRSILIDRNNKIIAGNKTAAQAIKAGITKVRIVDSDGREIIAVKRTDMSLEEAEAQALALYDNRVAQVNLEWDADAFRELQERGVKLEQSFLENELEKIIGKASVDVPIETGGDTKPEPDEPKAPAVTKTSMEQLFFDVESFLKFEQVMVRLEEFFQTEGNTDTIMAALEYVNANTIESDQAQGDTA